MIQEFKEFINRGNVVEMAVAFVMGLAFKPVVDAVVDRVLMPIIGVIVGEPNFDTLWTFACKDSLDPATNIVSGTEVCAGSAGAVITALVNFLLIAAAVFFVVKAYNRINPPAPDEPEADPEELTLLRDIRDSLRSQG